MDAGKEGVGENKSDHCFCSLGQFSITGLPFSRHFDIFTEELLLSDLEPRRVP